AAAPRAGSSTLEWPAPCHRSPRQQRSAAAEQGGGLVCCTAAAAAAPVAAARAARSAAAASSLAAAAARGGAPVPGLERTAPTAAAPEPGRFRRRLGFRRRRRAHARVRARGAAADSSLALGQRLARQLPRAPRQDTRLVRTAEAHQRGFVPRDQAQERRNLRTPAAPRR